jgi:hypothetical protein
LLATRHASLADACFEPPALRVAADFCALVCAAEAYDCGLRFLTLSPQCDIIDNREVSNVEGRDLAKSFGVPFFESSAKSRVNVEEAFTSWCAFCFWMGTFVLSTSPAVSCHMTDVTCHMSQVREIRRQPPAEPSTSTEKPRNMDISAQTTKKMQSTTMMHFTSGRCCAL